MRLAPEFLDLSFEMPAQVLRGASSRMLGIGSPQDLVLLQAGPSHYTLIIERAMPVASRSIAGDASQGDWDDQLRPRRPVRRWDREEV